MSAPSPETFGRYQLLRKLATGGMGQIYLARQKGPVGFEKLLVVKRILPHLSEEEEFIQMFFDEARIAAHLNHPNVAQIYDLGEVDGQFYIAMEFVAGAPVKEVNARAVEQKGKLPLGLACRIFADAAAGLDFAHHAKSPSGSPLELIHRDVSPQNILVGYTGSVKLIDFGVAKAANKISNTLTGTVKGKYAYMSPEQARGEDLDGRSDLFGLATVFWETLTSQRLWKRENETATMKAVVKEKAPAPSSVLPELPPALDALVLKALSKKRSERFENCGEFQLALEDFCVAARLPATTKHLAALMESLYAAELDEAWMEPTRGVELSPLRAAAAEKSSASGKLAQRPVTGPRATVSDPRAAGASRSVVKKPK